jgi:hypothetical protein
MVSYMVQRKSPWYLLVGRVGRPQGMFLDAIEERLMCAPDGSQT